VGGEPEIIPSIPTPKKNIFIPLAKSYQLLAERVGMDERRAKAPEGIDMVDDCE
jgi:hypothetical protein